MWARRDGPSAAAVGAACAVNLVAVFAYNIPDMAGYFMPLLPWGAMAALLAFARLARRIEKQLERPAPAFAWMALAAPLVMLILNRSDLAYLRTPAPQEYGRRLLAGAEPHALVLTEGDSGIYSCWYRQNVERFRTDVAVFGANFIAGSPWYREYFRGRHPYVLGFPFADGVLPSERDYNALWTDGILRPQLATGRPVYAAFDRPFLAPFRTRELVALLDKEDYAVPEGNPRIEAIGRDARGAPVVYFEAPEGGLVPRPAFAVRLRAPE
jgi:hypothetical protein